MINEYRRQAAFLKLLMSYDASCETRALLERLENAEKNERCIFSACILVTLIAFFGLAGLAYSAVLLPQFFDSSTHVVIRLFGALGLGSVLCLLFFVGLWVWYRNAANKIHEECRCIATRMLETRLLPAMPAAPAAAAVQEPQPPLRILEKQPSPSEHFGLGDLRKAS